MGICAMHPWSVVLQAAALPSMASPSSRNNALYYFWLPEPPMPHGMRVAAAGAESRAFGTRSFVYFLVSLCSLGNRGVIASDVSETET